MPWNITKDDRCPADKPYGVVGGASGNHLAGCHPTKAKARAQQSALYANEANSDEDPDVQKSEHPPPPVAYSTPPTQAW
jgi:hypothetical protein